MKHKRNNSELGLSIMEVMIALAVLFIILYQALLYDFETPKSKIEALLDVDYSFKEISGLLADKRVCKETFKGKLIPRNRPETQIFDIKARRCKKCPHTLGTAQSNSNCEVCSGATRCIKDTCNIYIYESSNKISNPINNRTDSELNKVSVSKIDGQKTHERVEIESMKLEDFRQKEIFKNERYGYTDFIIKYKVSGSSNSSALDTITRKIPIFVTANKNTHKIKNCSLSSTYCSEKDIPVSSTACGNQTVILKLGNRETGKKLENKKLLEIVPV